MFFDRSSKSTPFFHSNTKPSSIIQQVARNGGELQSELMVVLFDSHFLRSHIMMEHRQRVYSLVDLMSEVGGLLSAIMFIFGLVAHKLNREFLLNKIIRAMYFVKSSKH